MSCFFLLSSLITPAACCDIVRKQCGQRKKSSTPCGTFFPAPRSSHVIARRADRVRILYVTYYTRCVTPSVLAPLCTCRHRIPDFRRRLCGRVLEALIADVSIFPETSKDRVSLYKLFVAIFGSTSIEIRPIESPFAWEQRAAANRSSLPSMARHAFLLVSVEGFTIEETAEVLDVSVQKATELLDEASREISRQVATDIMINRGRAAYCARHRADGPGTRPSRHGYRRTHKEAVDLFQSSKPKMVAGRYPACRRMLRDRRGQRDPEDLHGAGHLHHRFPGEAADWRASGARLPGDQAPSTPDMVKALISQALSSTRPVKAAA
jgi:hypothetical protein